MVIVSRSTMETLPLKMKAIAPSKRRDNSPTLGGDIPEDDLEIDVGDGS